MKQSKDDVTSDDILGREAVDPDGKVLGIITKLHINRTSKKILGISVDQGFMKSELFIGIDYINRFGIDAIFLNTIPFDKYIGAEVRDDKGELIGHITEVHTQRKKIYEIVLKAQNSEKIHKGLYSINAAHIRSIGDVIVLKTGFRLKSYEPKKV